MDTLETSKPYTCISILLAALEIQMQDAQSTFKISLLQLKK